MSGLSRRTFIQLTGVSVICGCSGVTKIAGDDLSVVVFSDIHFNPFYVNDKTILQKLIDADASDWPGIFEKSAITTPSTAANDTNYPLLKLALASIKQNLGASKLVVYSGDLLGHKFPTLYTGYYPSATNADIQSFTDKTVAFLTQQIRLTVGDIPVLFAVGNCDSYTGYGPDSTFLLSNAEKYYTLLNVATDHDTFIGTFTSGGYYAVEPLGSDLLVIGLNTIEMSPLVQTPAGTESDQDAVKAELDWLDAKLAAAQSAGQKVWLLMHAPVGADEGTTAGSVNASGQLTSATMMWEANYQSWFMTILSKYPGVIAMTLAGHTHMDEFRIMSPGHALEITPGISPVFGNNPAYKIFTVGHDALKPLDYRCVNYNLSSPTAEFRSYYTYSEAYYAHGYLDESLARLFPRLKSSSTQRALYKEHFYSGNDTDNLITDTNWPVYWSGIGMMEAQDLINAVNSY